MALGEAPEHCVIRENLVAVKEAVAMNMSTISPRLEELAFISGTQSSGIQGTMGLSQSQKADNYVRAVLSKLSRDYGTQEEWFEKFVDVLANDTVEGELVKKLTRELGNF